MYKKIVFAVIVIIVLSAFTVPAALAEEEPAGSCPTGFHLEMVMDHDEHHHHHVGSDTDMNGDGFLCMKHVTPDEKVHVHIDNSLP